MVFKQTAEIATYNEPYMQVVFDTLDSSDRAKRREFKSRMDFLISFGHEDEAKNLKYEPNVPSFVPALSLVVAGGTKHIAEVLKAATLAYEKTAKGRK